MSILQQITLLVTSAKHLEKNFKRINVGTGAVGEDVARESCAALFPNDSIDVEDVKLFRVDASGEMPTIEEMKAAIALGRAMSPAKAIDGTHNNSFYVVSVLTQVIVLTSVYNCLHPFPALY